MSNYLFAINVGLNRSGESHVSITPVQVEAALRRQGIALIQAVIGQSATEQTLCGFALAAQSPQTRNKGLYAVCDELNQDCVAILTDGEGALIGPKAEEWGPFSFDHWLDPVTGQKTVG